VYQIVKHPKRPGYYLIITADGEQWALAVFKTVKVAEEQLKRILLHA
jgi:hypothetical protein